MYNNEETSIDISHDYYSIAECAKRLATTPQTIYKWIEKDQFVSVIKIGSTYRVNRKDFENWVFSILSDTPVGKEGK